MLQVLPPFEWKREMKEKDQTTRDIVKEVLAAHRAFASHYDKIADIWMKNQLNRVPRRLFDFCDKDLKYGV
jgi:hypothetical protein